MCLCLCFEYFSGFWSWDHRVNKNKWAIMWDFPTCLIHCFTIQGWGDTQQLSHSLVFPFSFVVWFRIVRNIVNILNTMFMFDRYGRNCAAATPSVKYECDAKDQTDTLAKSLIFLVGWFIERYTHRNICLFDQCVFRTGVISEFMMTSSNGNIFRVTGHLCGEFTGPRWIPRTKASDAELWCFLWSAPE